jgi:hypothetical protein
MSPLLVNQENMEGRAKTLSKDGGGGDGRGIATTTTTSGRRKNEIGEGLFFFLFPWSRKENNRRTLKQAQQILVRLLFPSSAATVSV